LSAKFLERRISRSRTLVDDHLVVEVDDVNGIKAEPLEARLQ